MKTFTRLLSVFICVIIFCSPLSVCADEDIALTCTKADEWSELFFRRNKSFRTWVGADGIYSVSLDGNDAFASADEDTKTFFIFSDTIIGKSDENGLTSGNRYMPSQTSALLTGNTANEKSIKFIYGDGGNKSNSHLFGEYKWMLDCLVVNEKLYIFGFPEEDWKPKQIDMITVPIEKGTPKYSKYSETESISELWYRDGNTALYSYGIGVMCNTKNAGAVSPDGYIYIYGYRDAISEGSRKDLIVSRIKEKDFPDFSKTEYFDGEGWCKDIKRSATVLSNISCEMSVTPVPTGPYKGKYIAIYTKNTEGTDICYAISDTPYGPFSEPVTFYTTPEHRSDSADGVGWLYAYNAKAHPHLSKGDLLLVSYNCNARDCDTQHPADYHPRFLWLDLDPENEYVPGTDISYDTDKGINGTVIVIIGVTALAAVAVTVFLVIKRSKDKRGVL